MPMKLAHISRKEKLYLQEESNENKSSVLCLVETRKIYTEL